MTLKQLKEIVDAAFKNERSYSEICMPAPRPILGKRMKRSKWVWMSHVGAAYLGHMSMCDKYSKVRPRKRRRKK